MLYQLLQYCLATLQGLWKECGNSHTGRVTLRAQHTHASKGFKTRDWQRCLGRVPRAPLGEPDVLLGGPGGLKLTTPPAAAAAAWV